MYFKTEDGLAQHKINHCQSAKEIPAPDTKRKPILRKSICPGCDRSFSTKGNMEKHVLICKPAKHGGYHKEIINRLKRKRFEKQFGRQRPTNHVTRIGSAKNTFSRCLMCLHQFCGAELERHLWICQAKRPCLNKVIEIKIEIKEEPTVQF